MDHLFAFATTYGPRRSRDCWHSGDMDRSIGEAQAAYGMFRWRGSPGPRQLGGVSGLLGDASTNVAFLIFKQALLNFDAGVASAGALFAVVLANIAAVFLIRLVGKNLDK